jgi:hypothetical protein
MGRLFGVFAGGLVVGAGIWGDVLSNDVFFEVEVGEK